MEYSNWYNDPFNNLLKEFQAKQKCFSRYDKKGQLICTVAKDGRKQKPCRYYYRNVLTKKCLFLEVGGLCLGREGD